MELLELAREQKQGAACGSSLSLAPRPPQLSPPAPSQQQQDSENHPTPSPSQSSSKIKGERRVCALGLSICLQAGVCICGEWEARSNRAELQVLAEQERCNALGEQLHAQLMREIVLFEETAGIHSSLDALDGSSLQMQRSMKILDETVRHVHEQYIAQQELALQERSVETAELLQQVNMMLEDMKNGEERERQLEIQVQSAKRNQRDKKDISSRMIQRMLHTHLAAAFDCFSEAIQLRVAHQTTVTKTISRRRTPLVKEMFECWLEYLDDVNQKVKEEAHAQAKQQIADELAKEKCAGEERVAEEKQHRAEQAKRIVQRLLHSQLAYAFDSYLCRALEVRRHRKTCRRVVLRRPHGN